MHFATLSRSRKAASCAHQKGQSLQASSILQEKDYFSNTSVEAQVDRFDIVVPVSMTGKEYYKAIPFQCIKPICTVPRRWGSFCLLGGSQRQAAMQKRRGVAAVESKGRKSRSSQIQPCCWSGRRAESLSVSSWPIYFLFRAPSGRNASY